MVQNLFVYSLDGIVHQNDSLLSSPQTVFGFMNQLKHSNTLSRGNDYSLSKKEKDYFQSILLVHFTFDAKTGKYNKEKW